MKKESLHAVRAEMAEACKLAGRATDSVKLIAVSKTKPWEDVAELIGLGQRDFGENYVQEAVAKAEALDQWAVAGAGRSAPVWHFIGSLQSNKAKFIPGRFSLFHALDSLSLAEKLDKASASRGVKLPCLVEVNVDQEASKAGVGSDQLFGFLEKLSGFPNLEVTGLMCIPASMGANPDRRPFALLRELQEKANKAGAYSRPLRELSMGMSGDFREAILEGATYVRVGTRLFGERSKK